MVDLNRRELITGAAALGLAGALSPMAFGAKKPPLGSKMKWGLVTYLWGKDWDLPTLIANCEKTGLAGVELRVEHAHGVMPNLNKKERAEVRKRFDDSPVVCVGCGTNQQFHDTDQKKLRDNIEGAKAFLQLAHDVGGSGIKVKPNALPKDVAPEKTIEQIGKSLNEVGEFAEGLGMKVRLEVHGGCSRLPIIRQIMDIATNKAVGVCWNCNKQDLDDGGLEKNFHLVKDRFSDIAHIRELNIGDYPYQDLMRLFVSIDYDGWILLEARTKPKDRIAALKEQKAIFDKMIAQGRKDIARG